MRRMQDVDISGKPRRAWPNLRWKYVRKRDVTEAGLNEDNATNRGEWMKKLSSYRPRRHQMTGKLKMKKNDKY